MRRISLALVLCIAVGLVGERAAASGPAVTFQIPQLSQPPTIDGHINDEEWAEAAAVTGVVHHREARIRPRQAVFFLGWTEQGLHVAVRSHIEPGKSLVAQRDSVELVLYPQTQQEARDDASPTAYHLILDYNGPFYSNALFAHENGGMDAWDPEVRMAHRVVDDPDATLGGGTRFWEMEFLLDLEALDLARPHAEGDVWRVLLCRNYADPREQLPLPLGGGFLDVAGYAEAVLVRDGPVVRWADVVGLLRGEGFSLELHNSGESSCSLATAVRILAADDGAEELFAHETIATLDAGERQRVVIPDPPAEMFDRGTATLDIRVTDDEELIFSYRADFDLMPELMHLAEQARMPAEPTVEHLVFSRFPLGTSLIDSHGLEWDLTALGSELSNPQIDPTGEYILLTSTRTGVKGVWVVDEMTKEMTHVADGRDGAWSPDGERIVFEHEGVIYEQDFPEAGRAPRALTSGNRSARWPRYSPDGEKLAFVTDQRQRSILSVLLLSDGSVQDLVEGELLSAPSWSPDGGEIAYQDGARLMSTDLEGRVTRLSREPGIHSYPAWSSNGGGIAYNHAPRPVGPWEMRAVDRAGRLASARVREDIDPGATITWTLESEADTAEPGAFELLEYRLDNGAATLRAPGMTSSVRMRSANPRRLASAHVEGRWLRLPADSQGEVTIEAPIGVIVLPDRLGDDVVLQGDALAREVDISFSPYAIGLIDDAGAMVMVMPASKNADMRLKPGDDGDDARLVVQSEAEVCVALVAQAGYGWVGAQSAQWEPPYDALWRVVVHNDEDRFALMSTFGAGDTEDALESRTPEQVFEHGRKVVGEDASILIYPFARLPSTPMHAWTATDLAFDALGIAGGASLLQDHLVTEYVEVEGGTTLPIASQMPLLIRQSYHRGFYRHMPDELRHWFDETMALLRLHEQRMDTYQRLAQAATGGPLSDRGEALLALIREGQEGQHGDMEEVIAALEAAKDGEFNREQILRHVMPLTLRATRSQEAHLHQVRQAARALRNRAADELLAASLDGDGDRAALIELHRHAGEAIGRRSLAERDWRGEVVLLPYGGWQDAEQLLRWGSRPDVQRAAPVATEEWSQ